MTAKATAFIAANAKSPVVYGSVIISSCAAMAARQLREPPRATGVYYRLQDGTKFTLFQRDLAAMKGVHQPRWAHVA